MIKKIMKGGKAAMKMAVPKGRITPGYKMPNTMKTTTPMTMPKKKTLPKKAMPMNYKNPKYKPSNGIGVGM